MRQAKMLILCILVVVAAGCSPRLLPGTDIQDTPVNHQILDVISAYRDAVESKNSEALMKLVSEGFFDNSGGTEATYDYQGLSGKVQEWAKVTKKVRLEIQVKTISVEGETARARYFYDLDYQVPGPDETLLWKRDSDTKEMTLRRENKLWKIISGI